MNSKVDASPLPFEIKRADRPPLAAFASVPCCLVCDVSGCGTRDIRTSYEVMCKIRQASIVHLSCLV
jgi:hypothetical protein